MKILHITPAYKPAYVYGGPTMSVAMLCEELTKTGVFVDVFTTTANGNTELDVTPNVLQNVDGVDVTYFKRITKDHTHFSPALLKHLNGHVRNYDVVHIHAWWNLVSVLSCFVAVKNGIPVVISPRGMLSSYSFDNGIKGIKSILHNSIGKRLLSKCHIHATSDYEAAVIKRLINTDRIHALPNFVKLSHSENNTSPMPTKELKLLFFSRIDEKKGLDILLESLKILTLPFQLTIAGDGNPVYIEKLKQLSTVIQDKISWVGFIKEDKFNLIAKHDLLVLPSHDENFANVVVESLSVGTAVLLSENVGLADYVLDNNFGWVCKTTPSSITENIANVAANKVLLEDIRTTAPTRIKQDFTGEPLTKQYIDLYQHVIDQ
ncbi:glycosyltransferase [Mucilaginibacter terrenus]|uniref:Glycosyltransferase n=1 Tax=Mucilaginibacter terrenus TaxID=2482727 RepID=A0A3E2NML8_9SPHI|nr:glycosyltransferase [Mucilaginibacter terrenus]RFZ82247.1 glycosyltransferase [Mucilaginibacter terrenus]